MLNVALDDLIHARTVESARLEFKKTWTPQIREKVLQTICAFANDFHSLNGGYIVLGIDEAAGQPLLPAHGLEGFDLEKIQKEIRGDCTARLEPTYYPVLSPETRDGRSLLVIWAPRGDHRPYQAPVSRAKGAERSYFVRLGSETAKAKGSILTQLMQLTAKIPFDDRVRQDLSLSTIDRSLVAAYLADVGSDHAENEASLAEVLRDLRLTAKTNGSEHPRNVALLFFSERPDRLYPGARIEVAQFRDESGDVLETQSFHGPLPTLVRNVLEYLEQQIGTEVTQKVPEAPEAERYVAFPHAALREAIVNAVFHRGYDAPPDACRVCLYPDRLEITSYPGPVPGLEPSHLAPGAHPPQLPARNPHVGELLKNLRLAETYHTGVPKIHRTMRENGSPGASFDFDESRTYFRVTLPAHPGYVVLHALRAASTLWHTGERARAVRSLEAARERVPEAGRLAAQLIAYAAEEGDIDLAGRVLRDLEQEPAATDRNLAYTALARAHLDLGQPARAATLLENLPDPRSPSETIERAILLKRSREFQRAHQLFRSVEDAIQQDPRALHEYGQTKVDLAKRLRPTSNDLDEKTAKEALNRDAEQIFRRVTALASDQPTRAAWAWFDLARVLTWLDRPRDEVARAVDRAIQMAPSEPRFQEWRDQRSRPSRSHRGRRPGRGGRRGDGRGEPPG